MKRPKQEPALLFIPFILIAFYIFLCSANIDTQLFIDCIAIFAAVAFFFEYHLDFPGRNVATKDNSKNHSHKC